MRIRTPRSPLFPYTTLFRSLQAMNTGHDGGMTTIHANTPRDALSRLETMVLMAGVELPSRAIREQVVSAIHFLVRSEEHTSELQSHVNIVCRLLLEKKNSSQ